MEQAATARPGFPGAPIASSTGADLAVAAMSTAGGSAASWPAIFAGAFVATGTTLALGALGAGLGFAAAGPWPAHPSATTFAMTTAIWLIVTQWVSAALGGYIAGRLRTRWVGTHTHEVFFRDTAHGLITWAVATVLIALLFAGATASGVTAAAAGGAGNATMSPKDRWRRPAGRLRRPRSICLCRCWSVRFIACVSWPPLASRNATAPLSDERE